MTAKTISYQKSTVSYRVTGEGKTVVLLHGFAEDSNIWDNQVAFLKNRFRIIIPDIPGSGHSQLIPNANIETYAEIIKLILDAEEAGRLVTLIGHSMGGYITLAFAEKYPQYLDSFGLFHSSAFADNEEKKQARAKSIDFINVNGSNAFLKTSIPGLFTKAYADAYPEIINDLLEKGKNFSSAALIQYYQAMIARPERIAVLKTFSKPILFVIGEHDNAIPLESSMQQCYLPAIAHVHILNKSAHMGMWEEADKSNQILFNFLQ
ncbi:MAG: alpha/beta hydrolase [Ferruginibacter sp.]|nr:alpha/beta hydrolase [Ferruginibacter sp.]